MGFLFSWSGGKDSALALLKAINQKKSDIYGLFTTVNADNQRVSMHGVRAELLQKQAECIGLPLIQLPIPSNASMEAYGNLMKNFLGAEIAKGLQGIYFGDIFLEDLKVYREKQLSSVGLIAKFPLWGNKTSHIAMEFINAGFKSVVTCVDGNLLNKSFVGRAYDENFISDLPSNVDPCGENGEFHTFVYDGPIFTKPLAIKKGDVVAQTYPSPNTTGTSIFWFIDLE